MFLAYLDPAAGGMVIQSIVALAVAIPFILRSQITRGIDRFRRRTESSKAHDPESPTD